MQAPLRFLPTCATALAAVLAAPAAAEIQPLVRTGDAIAGIGNVTLINHIAVNDLGAWIAVVDTDHPDAQKDHVLLLNGAVYLREGDPLPGSSTGFFPPSAIAINSQGDVAWTQNGEALYFNQQLVLKKGDLVTAPGSAFGKALSSFSQLAINDARQLLVQAQVGTVPFYASIFRVQVDAAGVPQSEHLVFDHVSVLNTGPMALNEAGDAIFNNSDQAVYQNEQLLAQVNDPAPVFGKSWGSLHPRQDVNDQGIHAYSGEVYGGMEVVVWNGLAAARTGEVIEGFAPYQLEGLGDFWSSVHVDTAGRLVWFADWSDPDTSRDSAIMRDHELLVQEGVSVVEGSPIFELNGSGHEYELSDNGRFLMFEARQLDGREGAYLLDLTPGGVVSHPACVASPASFQGFGSDLAPGDSVVFTLGDPQSPAALGFVGFSASPATGGPCGILVPGLGEILIGSPALVQPALQGAPTWYLASLKIPETTALIGESFFAQGIFLDATTPAEPLRLTSSSAEIHIGPN